MKRYLIGASLALAAPACAQPAPGLPDADPALWVVKDADTTIYLFGTFHMLDGKQDWFNDEVKTAFDKSDEVVLEAILPEDQMEMVPLVQKYAMDPAGKTLESRLTPELKAKFAAAKLPAAALGTMEPWFASMTLTALAAQKMGLKPEFGPEAILTKAAKARNIKVGELESVDFQLSLFDKMPEDEQLAFLDQTLDSVANIEKEMRPMVAAWSSGDSEGLVKIMNEGLDDNQGLYDLLFTGRNKSWAQWIATRLDTPGTVFIAVGAGHLAGKNSVADMLAARGIKTERVRS